ncbi:DUF4046 domain-containing protein [Paenibacillus sp. FSL M7-0802]|uniref:DUF4046 domain-containing protein n=1 Tax=Paenibacillus sp. FSL M7-0802 TaxID=2921536 RepID=UPI0030FA0DD5
MESSEIITIYREVLEGKRARFPNYFFDGKQGKTHLICLTQYLLEKHLNIPTKDIPNKVNARLLWSHRLRPPASMHGWSFMELIQHAYPGQFHSWQFKQVSNGYWRGHIGLERAVETIKYVIENKCNIPHNKIPQHIDFHFFKQHRLTGILSLFGDSPYQAINAVYPNQFQPWEFNNVPMNYWRSDLNIKKAMNNLIFDKLSCSSYDEAHLKLKKTHFEKYGYSGLFQTAFNMRLYNVRKWLDEAGDSGK